MKDQTILIVDDMSENIDLLVDLLKNHDLVTALDAKTALKILQEETEVDLILLDIMMPNMNGFELCKILKSNLQTANIPIIFLSAKSESANIQKGFEVGGVDYITKPFNPKELLSRVKTHLKLRAYEKNLEKQVKKEVEKNKLTQQIIYQKSKQAALGELLIHIAHQWNQPLASLGSLQLLQKTKLDFDQNISKEEHLIYLDKTEKLISFMGNTIDTFKNFYQPVLDINYFLLTKAINQILAIADATLKYNNISILLKSSEKMQTSAIENEFTQVLFSIINNAQNIFLIRKIKNPQIKIFVSDHKVIIEDNGGGIEEEMMNKLFIAYESNTNGSGIGLYIAKEIMEKNGGIISVENTNNGARFTIEFLTWDN